MCVYMYIRISVLISIILFQSYHSTSSILLHSFYFIHSNSKLSQNRTKHPTHLFYIKLQFHSLPLVYTVYHITLYHITHRRTVRHSQKHMYLVHSFTYFTLSYTVQTISCQVISCQVISCQVMSYYHQSFATSFFVFSFVFVSFFFEYVFCHANSCWWEKKRGGLVINYFDPNSKNPQTYLVSDKGEGNRNDRNNRTKKGKNAKNSPKPSPPPPQ
jgi:hypothetical protein